MRLRTAAALFCGVAMLSGAAAVYYFGIWPAPLLNMMEASTQHLLQQLLTSKIGVAP